MKKRLFGYLLLLLLLPGQQVLARFHVLGSSASFDEPRGGFGKILALRNGNTAFLHISVKDGIHVRIYDPQHKEIAVNDLGPSYGKLKRADVKAVFEISNNIVVFIHQQEDKKGVLYRLIISGNDGKLLEEKAIVTLPPLKVDLVKNALVGSMPYVSKDPASDNYAVALLYLIDGQHDKIELVHYNKDHGEVGRGAFQSAGEENKMLKYMGMHVVNDKEVVALLVGGSSRTITGVQDGPMLAASLRKGTSEVVLHPLDYQDAGAIQSIAVQYHQPSDQLYLLASERVAVTTSKARINTFLSTVRLSDYAVKTSMLDMDSIKNSAGRYTSEEFEGSPQGLFLKEDGSYSVVYEEVGKKVFPATVTHTRTYSGRSSQTRVSTWPEQYQLFLGDMGVVQYTLEGKVKASYYIPQRRKVDIAPSEMRYNRQSDDAQELTWYTHFTHSYYLNGKKEDYVFMNDLPGNQEKVDRHEKIAPVMDFKDCRTYAFRIGGPETIAQRELAFGAVTDAGKDDIAMCPVSDYDKERNIFITLKRDRSGRKSPVQLIWLQPE